MALERCVDTHALKGREHGGALASNVPDTIAPGGEWSQLHPQTNPLMQLHTRHRLAPQPLREGIEHHSHKPMQRNQMLPV